MPATVDIPGYRTIPIHTLPWLSLHTGHDKLASELKRLLEEAGRPVRIVIDGFSGVQWETFIGCLRTELTRQGVPARWIATEHCLLPPERVDDLLAPLLKADVASIAETLTRRPKIQGMCWCDDRWIPALEMW